MHKVYIAAIKATSFSVTLAILFIPPIITVPNNIAKIKPYNQALL